MGFISNIGLDFYNITARILAGLLGVIIVSCR